MDFIVEDPIRDEIDDKEIDVCENLDGNYEDGVLKGCCAVTLKSGFHLSGNFRKRRRQGAGLVAGPALERDHGVHTIWGTYKAGVLNGPGKARLVPKGHCKDIYSEGIVLEGNFVNGK